jgi:hypothetical protein
MRRAQQTIVAVRGDTHLATEIQSLLPSLARRGRAAATASQTRRGYDTVTTTFCLQCGGPKTKSALRCWECFMAARRKGREAAEAAGHTHATGSSNAHRTNLQRQPEPGEHVRVDVLGIRRRAIGDGRVRVSAPWKRRVLIDGVWQDAPAEATDESA